MAERVIKAEIDTAPPFESVKAAVSLFDEKAELKTQKHPKAERRASEELELLRENLATTKKQLSQAQSAKNELLLELLETRRLVELQTAELAKALPVQKTNEVSPQLKTRLVNKADKRDGNPQEHTQEATSRKFQDHSEADRKSEVEVDKKFPDQADEISQNQAAEAGRKSHDQATDPRTEETQRVGAQSNSSAAGPVATAHAPKLSAATEREHPDAVAVTSSEEQTTVEHVEDKAVESEHIADFISTNHERSLPSGSGGLTPIESEPQSQGYEGSWTSEDEFKGLTSSDVQMEIQATIEHLKVQLKSAGGSQERLAAEFSEAQANLSRVSAELEQARALESKARETEKALAKEVEELNEKLSSLKQEKDLLSATAESLRDELSSVRMELAALNEVESENYQASVELERVKAELASVREAESKAKEAVAGLTQALQTARKEADEAKQAAENSLEEAHKACIEAEQANTHLLTVESKLEAAIREAQAAKASETMALDELKLLTEKAATKTEEEAARQTHLTKLLQEAEKVASMKIAAALAQVEASKASEHEVKTKLEAALKDAEENKSLAKQASHRAEAAEAAKAAIENELRRRRKAAELAATSSPPMMRPTFHGLHSSVQTPDRRVEPPLAHTMHRRSLDGYVSADVSTESIAELLQLKVVAPLPPPPRPSNATVVVGSASGTAAAAPVAAGGAAGKSEKQLQKKKSTLMKLGSYLSRKKSTVSSSNA